MTKFEPGDEVVVVGTGIPRVIGFRGIVEYVHYGSGEPDHFIVKLCDGSVVGASGDCFRYANVLDELIWEARHE